MSDDAASDGSGRRQLTDDEQSTHASKKRRIVRSSADVDELDDESDDNAAPTQRTQRSSRAMIAGVIDGVELVNFMCHKKLHVDFGPRLNFVIGHNGSGKSAILTAITICLGGKASVTNRAANLKGLIKSGETYAECVLKLKNQGDDAFKHESYGDQIKIVRRITKDGYSYKIKSKDNRVISTKKDELTRICDHYGIQPENPMLILSQDAAKEFLASSSPEQLYKGSQLEQLESDYKAMEQSLTSFQESIDLKASCLPDLKEQEKQAARRLQEMEQAYELENQIATLKVQICWSQHYDNVAEKNEKKEAAESSRERVERAEEKCNELQQEITHCSDEIEEIRQRITDRGATGQPIRNQIDEVTRTLNEMRTESSRITGQERAFNDEIRQVRQDIERIDNRIEEERSRNARAQDSTIRDQKVRQHNQLKEEITNLERENQESGAENENLLRTVIPSLERRLSEAEGNRKQLSDEVAPKRQQLENLRHASENRLSVFGQVVPRLLGEIDAMAQRGEFCGPKPVGPIGAFVVVKDAKAWTDVVAAVIGRDTAHAFIVQDRRDVKPLRDLFTRLRYGRGGNGRGQFYSPWDIIVRRHDPTFDYSGGVPDRSNNWTPMIEEVNIEHNLVLQTLIDQIRLESIILVRERRIGEEVMRHWPARVTACYDPDCNRIGSRGGGQANMNIKYKANVARMLFARDYRSHLRELEQELRETIERLRQAEQNVQSIQQELSQVNERRRRLLGQLNKNSSDLRQKQDEVRLLRSEIDELDQAMTTNSSAQAIEVWNQEKTDCLARIQMIRNQFAPLFEQKQALRARVDEQNALLADLQGQLRQLHETVQEDQHLIDDLAQRQRSFEEEKRHYERKKVDYQNQAELALSKVEELERKVRDSYDKSMEISRGTVVEENELPGDTEKLGIELRQKIRLSEERSRELGMTLQEANENYENAKGRYRNAKRSLKADSEMHKHLTACLRQRLQFMKNRKKKMATETSIKFNELMASRGYHGVLHFDHKFRKLETIVSIRMAENDIPVSTQAVAAGERSSQRPKNRDPRSLSGGEKSYSTVCLLLSLWATMSSFIYALDEFDVFMDSVNRKISMNIIIEQAKNNPFTQYILITPQSMNQVSLGPEVKIIKLKDPRQWNGGQLTLNFTQQQPDME